MATPTVTPNTGTAGAGAGDQGGAAASSAAAQPQHSSDRALANFNSGDPAKGGAAPAADAKPAAAAAATPAAGADAGAAAAAGDLEKLDLAGVLGEDLTAAAEPAKPAVDAAAAAADPNAALEALKDNPRVIELQAAETAVKTAMAASPEWIKEPAHLTAAVQDAAVLWDITEGKQKVDVIFEAAKQQSPQMFQKIMADVKTYLESQGIQVAAPAAIDPATMTPEQKRIAALEKDAADRKTADEKAAQERKVAEFNTRVTTTKKTILDTKMPELLKDSIFEGEGELFLELVGKQLMPKTPELIAAIEKGDFKMLETAVKVARSQESKRFKERIDRAVALQKKKLLTVPKQPAAGAPAAAGGEGAQPAVIDREARRKAMAASLKGGAAS